MTPKTLIWIGAAVGGYIGGYIPTLFGGDIFSFWSIVWSTIGGLAGIWGGFKLSKMI